MLQEQQQDQSSTNVLECVEGRNVELTLPLQVSVHTAYEHKQSMIAGVILVITGVLSMLVTAIGIGVYNTYSFLHYGILFGIVFIVTGAFGIAAFYKNRCLVITFMSWCIISAAVAIVMFFLSLMGILGDIMSEMTGALQQIPSDDDGVTIPSATDENLQTGTTSEFLMLFGAIAAAVSIWGIVLGCKVTCCRRPMTRIVHGSNQPIVIFSGQPQQTCFNRVQTVPLTACNVPGTAPPCVLTVGCPSDQQQQQQLATPRRCQAESPRCRTPKSAGISR